MKNVKGTINRVELIGWLGAAPEQRTLPSGTTVCNFRIATKRLGGRDDDGNRGIETDWTPIETWERLANQCGQSLRKGSRVRVIGSLITRSWQDRDTGKQFSKTVVRADEVLFLDRYDLATENTVSEEALPF